MGFLYVRLTGFLYLVVTALLFVAIGLLGFASARWDTPPASLLGRR
jgi:hypothetical protein